jgi:hypothetical protein
MATTLKGSTALVTARLRALAGRSPCNLPGLAPRSWCTGAARSAARSRCRRSKTPGGRRVSSPPIFQMPTTCAVWPPSWPPCASMMERLMDSPMPMPPGLVVKKALNTWSR